MPKDIVPLLPLVAAGITLALGALGLLNPSGIQSLTGVRASAKEGISEVRATYGGFFMALGVMAFMTRSPLVYQTLGAAWGAAAAARVLSLLIDQVWTPKNLAMLLFEAAVGASFVAPWLKRWL
jgi:hypothetical protein